VKRGRKIGYVARGSNNARLLDMAVGERRYLETTLARYPHDMHTANVAPTRRPEALKARRFSTVLLTAVSASKAGDVRYLICIERLK